MDKTITTALLIIISMITALMLFNTVYPAVMSGGDAIARMSYRAEERLNTQIKIIHAASELDNDGVWHDTNTNGHFETFIWIKNIGNTRIVAVESLDLFFGPEGNSGRILSQAAAAGSYPYWTWTLENSAEWSPTTTLRIAIHYANVPESGRYYAKAYTASGVFDEYTLGM